MNQHSQLPEREIVAEQFGGKWIAWDDDGLRIIASSNSYEDAREQALAAGVQLPGLEFVPPSDRAFVGGV